MKKILCLVFMAAITCVKGLTLPLFNADASLTDKAKQLCASLKIDKEVANAKDFNKFFQQHLLRPKNKERWEAYDLDISLDEKDLDKVIQTCTDIGIFKEAFPKNRKYSHVIIFGSGAGIMQKSCEFLKVWLPRLLRKNKHIQIYFLTGSRPLVEAVDSSEIIKSLKNKGLPTTETYAAQLIWESVMRTIPLSCNFVNVDSSTLNKDPGGLSRANTRDTLNEFMKHLSAEKAGKILAISINPFIGYQDNVFRNELIRVGWFKNGGTLDTVGPCLDVSSYIERLGKRQVVNILLDNISRCAFEELRCLDLNRK